MQTLYIIWKDKDDSGIPIIDDQLRGMASIINTFFFHKLDADKDIDTFLVPAAEMLKSYTALHFLTLERLMRESEYPSIEEAIISHNNTMTEISAADIHYKALRDADGFLKFLKGYWRKHLCKKHPEYIQHIKNYLKRV